MWVLEIEGRQHRLDDLTVAQAEKLSIATGVPWWELDPAGTVAHLKAWVTIVGVDPNTVRLSQLTAGKDDLPVMWEDGRPSGGRPLDGWLASLTRPPWSFTPRQVREDFTLRDLRLISEASA